MRVTYKELMDRLGVGYEIGAYDTYPVALYDADKSVTYMGEVRVGPERQEVDCEIQIINDAAASGQNPMDHICSLRALPMYEGFWNVASFLYRGKKPEGEIYDWEDKACTFFRSVMIEINAGRVPNIEELYEDAFRTKERFSDQRGSGAGKAPKIKPGQMLNMKGGRGF